MYLDYPACLDKPFPLAYPLSVDTASIIVLLHYFAFIHFEYILRGGRKATCCSGSRCDRLLIKLLVRISAELTRSKRAVLRL